MNMRRMLFIVIPALFILNNAISFFVFQSGRSVQQSYNMMLERVLLYKEIDELTKGNLRAINDYIMDRSESNLTGYRAQKSELQHLQDSLSEQHTIPATDLTVRSYRNMLNTFNLQADSLLATLNRNSDNSLAYAQYYEEAEHIAAFIQEEGYHLIDMELSYYQPLYRQIFVQTEVRNHWGVAVFILNTLISILVAYWISLRITRPIKQLVVTAEQIAEGNLEVAPPRLGAHNEFRILSEAFGHMQDNLKQLMVKEREGLEKDRLVKELELEVLQNQMNPHFLFNSLNVLSKLALIEGAEQTSDLTVSMSNLLRYNLRRLDHPVTLRDEVEHAKEYFIIQQARFRNRIQFVMDIDESALGVYVPTLTLQPLLENIFAHGIEGMEKGAVIKLVITCRATEVWVEISDNGAGMSAEVRESLLHFESKSRVGQENGQSTGLGTRNVFRRLELFYGKRDIIDIHSEPGQGTTVRIRLPAAEKEDGDVSPTHCR